MIHRTREGDWGDCSDTNCDLKFHLPDVTVAEAEQMPLRVLLDLFEAFDPPFADEGGKKVWLSDNHVGRDYDLPAVVWDDGRLEWWLAGQRSRLGDKPAVMNPDGRQEWWVNGERHRDEGRAAIIYPSGREEYWHHGQLVGRSS